MTVGIVAVAGALFVAVEVHKLCFPDEAAESPRAWGAATQLGVFVRSISDSQHKQIPQFTGAFDLWDGQWWRVILSGMHHAGVLHLLMNCAAIWFMGRLLEPKLGKVAYLTFFVVAVTVSLLPEFLLEHEAVGMSGGLFAMFGVLMVLRKHDGQVASVFTDGVVQFGLVWLFACVFLTALEILTIANVAHFSGFAYGWITGQVLFGVPSSRRRLWFAFLAAHLAIIPAFYYVMHPVWIGRYHWYLARYEEDPQRQVDHFKKAVAIDPSLRKPWVYLVERYAQRGDWQVAWETILTALKHNRTDEESVKLSQKIWRYFRTLEQQQAAMQTFDETFQQEADKFRNRLGISLGQPETDEFPFIGNDLPVDSSPAINGSQEVQRRNLRAPEVDPNRPDSAAEGTST